MFEKLNKTLRRIERQYKAKAMGAGTALGGGAAVGVAIVTGAVTGPAAVLLMIPVYGGFMMGVVGGDPSRVRNNDYVLDDYKLVGTPADLSQIKAMQEYIDKRTEKLKHLGTLPEKLQRDINRHIADVAPVLQRVRVYKNYSWRNEEKGELTSFEFTRKFIDESGSTVKQPLARIELVPMGLLPRQEPARLVIEQTPARPALPAPDELRGEFKALADKVEGVAGQVDSVQNRLGVLENPQAPEPAKLEKPRFERRNGA